MTESVSVINRVREFVRKFNSDEYVFVPAKNDEQQKTLDGLANAVSTFEMAERDIHISNDPNLKLSDMLNTANRTRRYNYDSALSNLNGLINIAKINGLYSDRNQNNNSELQRIRELLDKTENDKLKAERKLEFIYKYHPQLKDLVENSQDSKLKDD